MQSAFRIAWNRKLSHDYQRPERAQYTEEDYMRKADNNNKKRRIIL